MKTFKRHIGVFGSNKKLTVDAIEDNGIYTFYYEDKIFNGEKELDIFIENYFKKAVV